MNHLRENYQIRRFEKTDYLAITKIFQDLAPERPVLAQDIQADDDSMPSYVVRERWVAEISGEIVGTSIITHDPHFFDSHQFILNIWVSKASQNRGIGNALYDAMKGRLKNLSATLVKCPVMENRPEGIRFIESLQFKENNRNFQSLLDLTGFDFHKFDKSVSALENQGIRIATLKEISNEPNYRSKIFELQSIIDQDIPGSDHRPKMTFEHFWHWIDRDLPKQEPFYIAVKGLDYLGMHFGYASSKSNQFLIAFSGVLRKHRGLGIATVLRAHGMKYAKENGFKEISTWNDSRNTKILSLNENFGFKREPEVIWFHLSSLK